MNNGLYLVKGCVLPRNWEYAFGYPGMARWLAAYWAPGIDEAMYEDGLMAGTANFGPYLSLTREYKLQITLSLQDSGACSTVNALSAIHLIGSAEDEASHYLVFDLVERNIYVAPKSVAIEFIKNQHARQDSPTPLSLEEDDIDEWLKSVSEKFKSTETKGTRFTLCTCHNGWVSADDGGFDPCTRNCDQGIIWENEQWTT